MVDYLIEPMQLDSEEIFIEQGEAAVGGNTVSVGSGQGGQAENNRPPVVDNFQIESAPFEVESYAAQFSCYGKIHRLTFISDHCPSLRIEALEHLLKYIKSSTYNVALYQQVQRQLVEGLSTAGGQAKKLKQYSLDQAWVESTIATAKVFTDKLETDLKNYKTNSIKESIRRGYEDMAKHYIICGDLGNALRCYFRSRDYCMSDLQLFTICMAVARLSLYQANYSQMHSFLLKAELLPEVERNQAAATKLACMSGVYYLVVGNFKMAAQKFASASIEHVTHDSLSSVLSPNSVAIYGTLCALATYDRPELGTLLSGQANFKLFLELEPQLREAATKFYESKYPVCLAILGELKEAFLLDIYLSPHVDLLYRMIRSHALVQYFRPYLSADLRAMAIAFGTSLTELEEELLKMILAGHVKARIDSHKKILYAKEVDQRLQTFERALEMSHDWCLKAKAAILKTACTRNGNIFIRSPPHRNC